MKSKSFQDLKQGTLVLLLVLLSLSLWSGVLFSDLGYAACSCLRASAPTVLSAWTVLPRWAHDAPPHLFQVFTCVTISVRPSLVTVSKTGALPSLSLLSELTVIEERQESKPSLIKSGNSSLTVILASHQHLLGQHPLLSTKQGKQLYSHCGVRVMAGKWHLSAGWMRKRKMGRGNSFYKAHVQKPNGNCQRTLAWESLGKNGYDQHRPSISTGGGATLKSQEGDWIVWRKARSFQTHGKE